jgi:hypothetical protein
MGRFEVYRDARLRELAKIRAFVMASLCEVNRRCGNPKCKCAKGLPHRAHVLTYKLKGKTQAVHVPKDMVKEVQAWVREYKRLKTIIRDISRHCLAILHRHGRVSRAASAKKSKSHS